jgi:hypothetical protein
MLILAADEISTGAQLLQKCIETVPGLAVIVALTLCALALYHLMGKDLLNRKRLQTEAEKVIAIAMQASSNSLADAVEGLRETTENQATQRAAEAADNRMQLSLLKTEVDALRAMRSAGG